MGSVEGRRPECGEATGGARISGGPRPRLSIGMVTFDDYDGVYFTIQALRLNQPEIAGHTEWLVIDNNPTGPAAKALKVFCSRVPNCRYLPHGAWHGTALRNLVFAEARAEIVLCVDCHVLIAPGTIARLIAYLEDHPGSRDLLQGPLLGDDLKLTVTHWEHVWKDGILGVWGHDERGEDPNGPPFEIPMQGLGLFAMRRSAWPGLNPAFRGFGGEEFYVHEKVRRAGGKVLCLPFLRWVHRFGRPNGVPYPNRWIDRMRNYTIGFRELGLDTSELHAHYLQILGQEAAERGFAEIERELAQGERGPGAEVRRQNASFLLTWSLG